MNFFDEDLAKVYQKLETNENGLSKKEREKRIEKYGLNKIEESKRESKWVKFLKQFKDLMIIILIFAAIFSFIEALVHGEAVTDSIIILLVVIMNAVMGFVQEEKAESAIEELKKMTTVNSKVKINDKVVVVNSETLVPGDIIMLDAGDKIPADCRIIQAFSAKSDESILTGESLPVEKDEKKVASNLSLSERSNMLYSGCSLVNGKVVAVVVATNYKTEIGKIATSLETDKKVETPLQKKIDDLSKILSAIIGIIILLMVVYGLLRGDDFFTIIMLAISLAVAAIPEGLPAVITITLSIGMNQMAKKNAIVRAMKAIETLGCTDVICSDKTGTITQNKMTIQEIVIDGKSHTDMNSRCEKGELLEKIFTLCNDVEVDDEGKLVGDPTEIAFLNYMNNVGLDAASMKHDLPVIVEVPFDSDRKRMSTVHEIDGKLMVLVKGGLDSILATTTKCFKNGKEVDIKKEEKAIRDLEKAMCDKSYRVLACAYKEIKAVPKKNVEKELESDLIFVGMVGMIDPPRDTVFDSIKQCKTAGVRPVMITGDSLPTAVAIAKSIGIIKDSNEGIEGKELDKYSDEELKDVVKKYSVYARVSPEHKVRIVNAWQENGKIVAMTGDGVNDAPAIKMAHVGVGMGITGTEVTKGVADVILVDDCFSTIVTAVEEGRRIFDNIKNAVLYLLSSNFAEVIIVLFAMFNNFEILLPIQLLYINLVTDSIPSICLAFEKSEKDIMKRKPRGINGKFFTPFFISCLTLASIVMSVSVILAFMIGNQTSPEVGMTMAFLGLVMLEIVYSICCRNPHASIFKQGLFSNKVMNYGLLGVIVVNLIVFLTPVGDLFKVASLTLSQVGILGLIALVAFIIIEICKPILYKVFKDK
ncbi:MAG: cation-translocating P-type ATPase [Bacilli bacterium]|nr:cation-translocating P-type ATPase [Bacilli bacterium]